MAQLQADIAVNELAQKQAEDAIAILEQQLESAVTANKIPSGVARSTKPNAADGGNDGSDEQKRRDEEPRIRELRTPIVQRQAEEKMHKVWEEEERMRKEEAKTQKKLRDMGVCPEGVWWTKQSNGYMRGQRSYWVPNA